MKPFTAIFFFTCFAMHTSAQSVDFYGKEVTKDICAQYGMKDDKEAKQSLDTICSAAGIPNNFVLAPCTNIDNCFALYKNGYSYIVYDIQFFNKVKTFGFTDKKLPKNTVDWAALTVLAHEIGHHMCLHTTNPNLASIYTPVQIELQADEYAGTIMYRLHATLAQAQQAMNTSDVPEQATITHPGRADRLAAIAKGWNKEYLQHAVSQPQVEDTVRPAINVDRPGIAIVVSGEGNKANLQNALKKYFESQNFTASLLQTAQLEKYPEILSNADFSSIAKLGLNGRVKYICTVTAKMVFKQTNIDGEDFLTATGSYDVVVYNIMANTTDSFSIEKYGSGKTEFLARQSAEEKFMAEFQQHKDSLQ